MPTPTRLLIWQINQYRDALNAYTKSICLDPRRSEVWYDLGMLYESCHQLRDAFNAYQKAEELDRHNPRIVERVQRLKVALEGEGAARGEDVLNGPPGVEERSAEVPPGSSQGVAAPSPLGSSITTLPYFSSSAIQGEGATGPMDWSQQVPRTPSAKPLP